VFVKAVNERIAFVAPEEMEVEPEKEEKLETPHKPAKVEKI
jgi:hypothetical protein